MIPQFTRRAIDHPRHANHAVNPYARTGNWVKQVLDRAVCFAVVMSLRQRRKYLSRAG